MRLFFRVQAHRQLHCITTASLGVVVVTTGAGLASTDFDVLVLLQAPVISSVSPLWWSTTGNTSLVISGERYVYAAAWL